MPICHEQKFTIAEVLDAKFWAKYRWSTGAGDYFRLWDSYQPTEDELVETRRTLSELLGLTVGGDVIGDVLPMNEILSRITIRLDNTMNVNRSCRGCAALATVKPEKGGGQEAQFCLAMMVNMLQELGYGGQQAVSILQGIDRPSESRTSPENMKRCIHGVKEFLLDVEEERRGNDTEDGRGEAPQLLDGRIE